MPRKRSKTSARRPSSPIPTATPPTSDLWRMRGETILATTGYPISRAKRSASSGVRASVKRGTSNPARREEPLRVGLEDPAVAAGLLDDPEDLGDGIRSWPVPPEGFNHEHGPLDGGRYGGAVEFESLDQHGVLLHVGHIGDQRLAALPGDVAELGAEIGR